MIAAVGCPGMDEYAFIGFNGLFGEYAETVHALGGIVKRVVINLPMDTNTGILTFREQLERYHAWLDAQGLRHRVEIVHLRDFKPLPSEHHVLASRGLRLQPLREYIKSRLGVTLEPLVHPTAIVARSVSLPEGIIIRPNAIIGNGVSLGPFCGIGSGSYVGHDSLVEACCDLAPGAHLASGVKVRFGARLGIHCTVINHIDIGRQAHVAAGAVVTRDVEPLTLVAGVPAVFKKKIEPKAVPESVPGLP